MSMTCLWMLFVNPISDPHNTLDNPNFYIITPTLTELFCVCNNFYICSKDKRNGIVPYSGIQTQTIIEVGNHKMRKACARTLHNDLSSTPAHAIWSRVCIYRLFGIPNPDLPLSVLVPLHHCLLKFWPTHALVQKELTPQCHIRSNCF